MNHNIVELDFNDEALARLDHLVKHTTCAGRAEVMRLALALFDKAVQGDAEGFDDLRLHGRQTGIFGLYGVRVSMGDDETTTFVLYDPDHANQLYRALLSVAELTGARSG